MIKKIFYSGLISIVFLSFPHLVLAQEPSNQADTFFLARKKGLLGRLGRSISTTPAIESPVKIENPFLPFKGKIIRHIEILRLGFERDLHDTTLIKNNLGAKVGKLFHKNSSDKVIRKNLFFKEGAPLFPYLLADNERFLRSLVYIKDAKIIVDFVHGSTDSVDVFIITKDVFSIGGKVLISSTERGRAELKEENLFGTGNRLLLSGYYEAGRNPESGVGSEFIGRNIGGSFIDLVAGYQDYRNALSSNRNQETVFYARLEKPLVTAYIPSTGAIEWSYQKTRNVYDSDSLYKADIRYTSYNIDAWFGYSLDSKKALYANNEIKVHRFVAVRGFRQFFQLTPLRSKTVYDYRFTDFTGALASLNIFKQEFYKSSFIYGFGRSEDIPEGFSVAVTGGYINKQNIKRPYSGLDVSLADVGKQGNYSNYTLRLGGYFFRDRFEDIDLLLDVNHFTRLHKLSSNWYNRIFINAGITAQANPVLNVPLFLDSKFGLPYFNNGTLNSDLRAAVKTESVFYNTTKVLGFRFAPFIFTDAVLLKPSKMGLHDSDIFTALGCGVRTRNENLVFGTIELKGYYFPRTNADMNVFKVDLNSNLNFKFKSNFISRPDFINPNY